MLHRSATTRNEDGVMERANAAADGLALLTTATGARTNR